jgi:hypothetical protein
LAKVQPADTVPDLLRLADARERLAIRLGKPSGVSATSLLMSIRVQMLASRLHFRLP